jgi:hypothetical protein
LPSTRSNRPSSAQPGANAGSSARHWSKRQAEVDELDAVAGHEDIRRLQVAMDDAVGVEPLEAVGHGEGDAQRFGRRLRPPDARRERLAGDELERQVGLSVPLAELEDLADGWIGKARRRLRFANEPRSRRGIRRGAKELERHVTAQRRVLGLVYDAHTAFAELRHDTVAADRGVGCQSCFAAAGLALEPGPLSLPEAIFAGITRHRNDCTREAGRWMTAAMRHRRIVKPARRRGRMTG